VGPDLLDRDGLGVEGCKKRIKQMARHETFSNSMRQCRSETVNEGCEQE
jgi:hypothetical protein